MALTFPTPPKPPTIDKGDGASAAPKIDAHKFFQVPFKRDSDAVAQEENAAPNVSPQTVERHSPTAEEAAREAVEKGAGALSKRNVSRPDDEKISIPRPSQNQTQQNLTITNNEPKSGKAIVREFQNEDRQFNSQTAVETPRPIKLTKHESYGGIFWIVTLIAVVAASFIFVKKFLLSDKPALKKSDLFEGSGERLKAAADKVSAPIEKPPPKKDDRGKHFEVRI